MKKVWKNFLWCCEIVLGCSIFALGFSLFLMPNGINVGGLSGLVMIVVQLMGVGSVGVITGLINLPLTVFGGLRVNRRFFWGTLVGMSAVSVLIDLFAMLPAPEVDVLTASLYGGAVCGFGLGIVFLSGGSTGGSDIVVRLLKFRYRNAPLGAITTCFDLVVITLTGIVFRDLSKALYSGVAVFVCGQVINAVVYRFDYSKVALIITGKHELVAEMIARKLYRGATFLNGEGSYTHKPMKVVLTAVKRQQLAELKELVSQTDPDAFVIVQEAHQVLGDGFSRYTRDAL